MYRCIKCAFKERYKGVFVFNKRHGGVFRKSGNNHEYRDDSDVSNDGAAVKFKAAVSSKNNSLSLSETIHISRKDLNKDYQFVENNIELSSKLDKLYNLSKME